QIVRIHPHRTPSEHQRRRQRSRPLHQWLAAMAGPVPIRANGFSVLELHRAQCQAPPEGGSGGDVTAAGRECLRHPGMCSVG
ncbi:hypothetical protein, partial [Enterococcus sp. HPCN18]|uniref:hypothetical protein n=1 Tax=Enterococcus sp. HPCN18 TaxID=2248751 RepID=UPI0015EBB702